MTDMPAAFARRGYVVYPALLQDPQLTLLYRYALTRADAGTMQDGDRLVANTPAAYGDFMMDGLLTDLLENVQSAVGAAVFPTYSYFRKYKRGDELRKHKDGPSCEISVSLCLGYEAATPWPLWIDGHEAPAAVPLQPGDAMLYKGVECAHWREPFEGDHLVQVFLHYVDQRGPYAEWKYDKRKSLAELRPTDDH